MSAREWAVWPFKAALGTLNIIGSGLALAVFKPPTLTGWTFAKRGERAAKQGLATGRAQLSLP